MHVQWIMMLNDATGGKAWAEHGVCLSQVLKRNAGTAGGSEILWEYAKETWIEENVKKGNIRDC